MSNNPFLSLLGLVRKAGKLLIGFAASKQACTAKKAKLVIAACNISEKSFKEINYFGGKDIPIFRVKFSIDEISAAIGIKAGIVAVCDEGFAIAITKAIEKYSALK